ncbi:2-hydroxy-6-oxononadienedioate/2-hydroxy-6-oxononatrienedioate hydrolase [Roseivivax jejudonensis]|uniref:2-hydroxy-6-oxononadienedioate/2-hydroxy-6-oxononatrienedioate hydrolase n=1 Tax=Roseivivax jejudonensis TaxID=1529041 RepID=A0A1X7A5W8_9RHOB|nr:alpha/beta hydrolase [Roseivivax jejudonensis]SLN71513.1 2-hydroxy-6-oxononadienedioate/2-hydroxy-6-oxononatrienedioate hydrolase [Roseivivax jejudonensis]
MDFPADTDTRTVSVWNDKVEVTFRSLGRGPDLIYLHPAAGLGHSPFLAELSKHFRIHAPHFPGTDPERPREIHKIGSLWDLVLIYEEAIRAMDLAGAPVMGESFGGMLSLELAANFPDLFSRLALLAPVGIWREDIPIANWIAAPPEAMPAMLFADPAGPAAKAIFTPPDDPDVAADQTAALVWSIGVTGKFLWPLPEKGLESRLHRVTAPVHLIWGNEDRLIPITYADLFAGALKDAKITRLPDAGHALSFESGPAVIEAALPFLAPAGAARGVA